MEDQGRHPDRGQHMTDIAFIVCSHQSENCPRARRGALEPAKPLDEGFVSTQARRIDVDQDALAPVRVQCAKESIESLLAQGPWFRLHRSKGAKHHESRGSLGVGGGEHQCHRAAFRPAKDGRARRTGRIQYRLHVANSLFETVLGDPIGEALAALVEYDYPRERGESFQNVLVGRQFPEDFDVRKRSWHQHDVARAVAENPVSDVHIAALSVLGWSFHQRSASGNHTGIGAGKRRSSARIINLATTAQGQAQSCWTAAWPDLVRTLTLS